MDVSKPTFYLWRFSFVSIALSVMLFAAPFQDGIKAFDNKDYATAIKIWQPLADEGNMAAQYNMGILFENAFGVDHSDVEAFKWYSKAAAQGHMDSQFNLGIMYGSGVGTQKNEELAEKWFRLAAAQGDVGAKKIIDNRYVTSKKLTQSNNSKKSSTSHKGKEKLDEKLDMTQITSAPEMHQPAVVVPVIVPEKVSLPLAASENTKISEATAWLLKSAKQGEARAQYMLGLLYSEGRGVVKDDVESARWYTNAARQGYADAQYNLALDYLAGRGVSKNDTQAVSLLNEAAQQGHPSAQFNLGLLYSEGRGIAKNEAEAVRWYMQAARQGHADAQFYLALAHAEGIGISKNEAEAIRWYRKAAEQGHSRAQYNLAIALTNTSL